jgi:hypothetical protein
MFDRALTSVALSAVAAVLIQPSLIAQDLSVTVSPNPAPPGATITVTAQDATGLGWYTPFGCLISSIVAGSPTGTTVKSFPCTFLGVAIPPCGGAAVRTGTWNTAQPIMGGGIAQPGLYYFEILKSIGPFGAISTEWHSVTLDSAMATTPALSAVNAANWGSVFQMQLAAPNNGLDAYVVALSATTNTGLAVTGSLYLSLDIDAIFNLTFPTPDPLIFGNFQASLDAMGNSPAITINIPPLFAGCIPLHAQAATVSSLGSIALSNDLHFTIQ